MYYYNTYLLLDTCRVVDYNEGENQYIKSVYGSNKYLFFEELLVFFGSSFVDMFKPHVLISDFMFTIYSRNRWRDFFKQSYTQYMTKFRLVGRGYKLINDKINLCFRLGYSHNIYYNVSLSFYIPKKEKAMRFWKIFSFSKEISKDQTHIFKHYKLPDVYTLKGVLRENEWFIKKEGKKAYSV